VCLVVVRLGKRAAVEVDEAEADAGDVLALAAEEVAGVGHDVDAGAGFVSSDQVAGDGRERPVVDAPRCAVDVRGHLIRVPRLVRVEEAQVPRRGLEVDLERLTV